ncbi:MAG: putative rRNA maturation factor [Acidimicrobiaceae bacterium]|nr:putative rRNA maturation factor [Acidimicrobiaceae bacterium]
MAVEVFAADEQGPTHPVDTMGLILLAEKVLAAEGVRGDAELSILFVDEQAIADLNKRFAGKDGPTDVLSFPIDEEPVEGGRSPDSGGSGPGDMPTEPSDLPTLLGDIVICPAVAARNVAEGLHDDRAATYEDELALLVVHGILHLMGMDHVDDEEATAMEKREQELLAQFHAPGATGVPGVSGVPGVPGVRGAGGGSGATGPSEPQS